MKRKSSIPALPAGTAEHDVRLGFTAWVHLARPGIAADVQAFRRGLDRYLESCGLTRTLNPLHTLISSPERILTLDDQIGLLAWMVEDSRAIGVEIGALQQQTGIPSQRDRVAQLPAMFSDHALFPMVSLYQAGRLCAEQVVEMLGGYHAPVALH
jgi:hypothetical protein